MSEIGFVIEVSDQSIRSEFLSLAKEVLALLDFEGVEAPSCASEAEGLLDVVHDIWITVGKIAYGSSFRPRQDDPLIPVNENSRWYLREVVLQLSLSALVFSVYCTGVTSAEFEDSLERFAVIFSQTGEQAGALACFGFLLEKNRADEMSQEQIIRCARLAIFKAAVIAGVCTGRGDDSVDPVLRELEWFRSRITPSRSNLSLVLESLGLEVMLALAVQNVARAKELVRVGIEEIGLVREPVTPRMIRFIRLEILVSIFAGDHDYAQLLLRGLRGLAAANRWISVEVDNILDEMAQLGLSG